MAVTGLSQGSHGAVTGLSRGTVLRAGTRAIGTARRRRRPRERWGGRLPSHRFDSERCGGAQSGRLSSESEGGESESEGREEPNGGPGGKEAACQ